MPTTDEVNRCLLSAAVCEVFWKRGGAPDAHVATPLLWDDVPTLSFSYAEAGIAEALAGAEEAVVTLSDPRAAATGWRPLELRGRPRLIADPDGTVTRTRLLDQELRKFPPSRALADSLLLQREYWWYLPRLLVPLEVTHRGEFTAIDPAAALLSDGRRVVAGAGDDEITVPDDAELSGSVVALRHDFSVPDMERRTTWRAQGELRGRRFVAHSRTGSPVLPPASGLLARLRRHRALSRACRSGLRTRGV